MACGDETPPQSEAREANPGIGRGGAPVIVVSPPRLDDEEEEPAPEGALSVCEVEGMPTRGNAEGSLSIDDFEDGDGGFFGNGLAGGWFGFGDGTGSQNVDGEWLPEPAGRADSSYAAHVFGGGYTSWGSGSSAVLASRSVGDDCLFDASAYDGVTFWLRGSVSDSFPDDPDKQPYPDDQGVLKFQIMDKTEMPFKEGGGCDSDSGYCYDHHRKRIAPTRCWTKYVVRFDELKKDGYGQHPDAPLDTKQILHLGFEAGPFLDFDYWVDDIEFFVGEAPQSEEDCDGIGVGGAGGAGGGTQ